MPLLKAKFCGLTLRDVTARMGFGSQTSEVTLQLVADPTDGDSPAPPLVGAPCYFELGGFSFGGLLRRWGILESPEGAPVYECELTDPREILEGCPVITGGTTNSVSGVPNLQNPYGYWENISFGASGVNPGGMLYSKVLSGLAALCNSAPSAYGQPLSFAGHTYGLDLSALPVPSGVYRVPAGNINLLELIQQICQDGGCDFFVALVGTTITVKTVSRFNEPPLGTISALLLTESFSGATVRTDVAVESRHEVTSSFLVGASVTSLSIVDSTGLASFWGYANDGTPIVGVPGTHADIGAVEYVNLNAKSVADIIGSVSYATNTAELRCAMGGFDMWSIYISKYKNSTIGALVITPFKVGVDIFAKVDLINDDPTAIVNMANNTRVENGHRLHEFLKGIGEAYYGKEFLARLPDILTSTDPETGQTTFSYEPTESGWVEGGAAALGLPVVGQDVFQQQDERVVPFAFYSSIAGTDSTRISWGDSAVDPTTGAMWTRATLSTQVVFLADATPTAHLRLGSVLYDNPIDEYGDRAILDPITLNGAVNPGDNIKKTAFGGTAGSIFNAHPAARYPTSVCIPLKSNTSSYGPWFYAGAPGKTTMSEDASLSPWDFGGTAAMNNAGASRVVNAVTNMIRSESGSIVVAGAPSHSLGDILVTDGPLVTGINVRYGVSGVSTETRMETFTPAKNFGLLSKQNSERLKRISLAAVEQRRLARKALAKAMEASRVTDAAYRGWKRNKAIFRLKESPLDVLVGESIQAGNGDTRVFSAAEKYEAALLLQNADADQYKNKAMMGLTGLVRPFSTNPSTTALIASYTTPEGTTGGTNNPLTNTSLNPFRTGNDLEVLAWGDTYAGASVRARGNDASNTRALALRGPLVVEGWGYDLQGNRVPSDSNYLRKSDHWRVGTVDLLWDDNRGVWTSHDIVTASAVVDIASGASGVFNIGGDASGAWPLTAYNNSGFKISAGDNVSLGYTFNENRWTVITTHSSGSASGSFTVVLSVCPIWDVDSDFSALANVIATLQGEVATLRSQVDTLIADEAGE